LAVTSSLSGRKCSAYPPLALCRCLTATNTRHYRVHVSVVQRRQKLNPEESLETMRARLLYQSKKRGILENDILIGVFGEKYVNKMDRETLKAYDTLINGDIMEWDLYYYMSGKEEPPAELMWLTQVLFNSSKSSLIKGSLRTM
ncbi:TPR repeat region, partial [Cooperia oncophora]